MYCSSSNRMNHVSNHRRRPTLWILLASVLWILLLQQSSIVFVDASSYDNEDPSLSELECRADGTCSTIPSTGDDPTFGNDSTCGLFIAESSIPGAGWGIYAGFADTSIGMGNNLNVTDVVIQLVDAKAQAKLQQQIYNRTLPKLLLSSFFWKSIETHAYFDADDVQSIVPGFGMLANSHLGLVNLEQRACATRSSGGDQSTRSSASVGASSSYHDCTFVTTTTSEATTATIPNGHELFASYGDGWFQNRAPAFGDDLPLSDDYTTANAMVQLWQRKVVDLAQHHSEWNVRDTETMATDLWSTIVRGIGPLLSKRTRRALPLLARDAARINYTSSSHFYTVAYHDVPNVIQSRDWLQQHGLCLDHLAVRPLRKGTGKRDDKNDRSVHERTAVARRFIAKGAVVAPAPLIHLSRHHLEILLVDTHGEPDTVLWKGHQILLNYCYGHPASSLLLFPYSPGVNLINHPDSTSQSNQQPNVAIRWSRRMRHPEWLQYNVSTILDMTEHSGLMMEFYALRDIEMGDEVLLDYGQAWTDAWAEHRLSWRRAQRLSTPTTDDNPLVHMETYRSAWDYLQGCNQNISNDADYACLFRTPSWIDVRCWVDTPSNLTPADENEDDAEQDDDDDDEEEDWLQWRPPEDHDELYRVLDDTLACQVLSVDEDEDGTTYRIRVQRNHWLDVAKSGVYVKNVPRSAIDLVDQPYTGNQFLRSAFRHEIQLPDEMLPPAWRDLDPAKSASQLLDEDKEEHDGVSFADVAAAPPCGLYMAESSIPNSGLGIYSANNISKGKRIFYEDLVVHVEDFELNAKLRHWSNKEDYNESSSASWILDSYYWNPKTTMGNFDADDVQSIMPGFGMLSNSHAAIVNADVKTPLRFANLHRGEDPGAGASTIYHGAHFTAAKDIEAGSEMFVQYGQTWFVERTSSLGLIPLSSDFFYADFFLLKLDRIVEHDVGRGGNDTEWVVDLLSLIINICSSSRPRLANAIPRDLDGFRRAVKGGSAALTIPNRIRPIKWLESNGRCLDNIRPGPSTIYQAGRGAFATRLIPEGSLITTMPLAHLRRHDMEIYGAYNNNDKNGTIWRDGSQLLLNYCYGHPDSSLLLFPYSPVVNYVNHNLEHSNAKLQWSKLPYQKMDWFQRRPDEIASEDHTGLIMEMVATRDIQAGEEIFLSYGQAWDEAWQTFVDQWEPDGDDLMYTPTATLNQRLEWLRTADEMPDSPYTITNRNDISTVCFVGSLKNPVETQSPNGDVLHTVKWTGRGNLFDTSDYAYPCVILERHHTLHDYDHAFDRKDSIKPVSMTFNVLLKQKDGQVTKVDGVPRKAIHFFDSPYKSDDMLRTAFRHEIQIPDEIIPKAWRDLKDD